MNEQETARLLAILMAAWPSQTARWDGEYVEATRRAYHLALEDLDYQVVQGAAAHLISKQTFFPSAGEVRRTVFGLREWAEGVPSAQDAWAEVSRRLGRGFYEDHDGWYVPRAARESDWSCPLVQKAIEGIGGWFSLRISENRAADRARFIEAYEAYLERERETTQMLPQVREMVGQLASGMRLQLSEPQRGE